jgi:hypothetical protein
MTKKSALVLYGNIASDPLLRESTLVIIKLMRVLIEIAPSDITTFFQ